MLLSALFGVYAVPGRAWAFLPDPSILSDPSALGLGNIPAEVIRVVGIALDNRPYQPATPLGLSSGADISVEATMVRIPPSFKEALELAGFGEASDIPVIPSPKINIHKGISSRSDLGGSLVWLQGYYVWGVDFKTAITDPELEGPTVALRFSYNYAKLGFVTTHTYTPQILISRRLEFADPYLGLGYQYVRGRVQYQIEIENTGIGVPFGPYRSVGGGGLAFMGVGLRIPAAGLKLTMEGSYSFVGAHALGAKFGFNF
jgi:hypothetical protein